MKKANNSELKLFSENRGNKVGKVCGCLHVIKNYEEPQEFVTLETLEAAIRLVDHLDKFAIKFQKNQPKLRRIEG